MTHPDGSQLTATERALRGRIGAFALHARYDARETTHKAREAARTALDARLIDEFKIDPGSRDFQTRLAHARSAHFSRLALRSAKKRRGQGGAL